MRNDKAVRSRKSTHKGHSPPGLGYDQPGKSSEQIDEVISAEDRPLWRPQPSAQKTGLAKVSLCRFPRTSLESTGLASQCCDKGEK